MTPLTTWHSDGTQLPIASPGNNEPHGESNRSLSAERPIIRSAPQRQPTIPDRPNKPGTEADPGERAASPSSLIPQFVASASSPRNSDDASSNTDSSSCDSSEEEEVRSAEVQPTPAEIARAFLAQRGIEADAKDANGVTALMVAAWENEREVVENLLAAGAPANCVKTDTGDNALILAASLDHSEVVSLLLQVPGIELNKANRNGDTALMVATSNNCADIVRQLLTRDADVDLFNKKRRYTALMLAADYGLEDIAQMLVKRSKKTLNAVNSHGDTALILAAAGKHAKVVRLLLDEGADTRPVDSLGYTALKAAIAAEDAAVVELFLKQGHELADFDPFSGFPNAFRIAVTDLAASLEGRDSGASSSFAAPGDPLQFFTELGGQIPGNGDSLPLMRWLRGKGMAMACARELASLLAPAHAWASKAARGNRANSIAQQRLIYCLGALGQLEAGGFAEKVLGVYRQAGISSDAVNRLDAIVRRQLSALAELAANAAAQFGGQLIEMLIARCLAQTSSKYEVRPAELQDCLVQEGFVVPLAHAIASGWQATLAEIMHKTSVIPSGLPLVQTIDHIHKLVIEDAQRVLAHAVNEKMKTYALLHSLEAILPTKNEEVIHGLYQTQINWLSQFYEQSRVN
jgi:ankyrin repeat protein